MSKDIICAILILFFVSCKEQDAIQFPPGGLSYPKQVAPEDSSFYMHQYKDSLSTLDSLYAANYGLYLLSGFDEPNLSIHSQKNTVFRFVYEQSLSYPVIISVTENKLIVKQGEAGWIYPYFDIDRLSNQEQEQLNRSEWYFRSGYKKQSDIRWHPYFDSLLHVYPHLADINTFKTLHQKAEIRKPEKFQYSQRIIPISGKQFLELTKLIDNAGFWTLPREFWCDNPPSDGASITLEANTENQYKIVMTPSCSDDHRKFVSACQKIVDLAGLSKKIQLIWDGTTEPIDTLEAP